jgi:hypothetical protein
LTYPLLTAVVVVFCAAGVLWVCARKQKRADAHLMMSRAT